MGHVILNKWAYKDVQKGELPRSYAYTMAAELGGCHPIYERECYNNAVEILRSKLDCLQWP